MKQLQRICLGLLVLVGGLGFVSRARAVIVSEKIEDTYHFTYYPDVEVYYVPEKKVYWWSENGTWRSASTPPPGVALGTSVVIVSNETEPWRHHEVIVKKYGGRHAREELKKERREERNEEKHED